MSNKDRKELRKRLDETNKNYLHSPEQKANLERARRINRLTPEELMQEFTI